MNIKINTPDNSSSMVYFFYKCYYVFFLYYARFKNETPWYSAITALAVAVVCILMVSFLTTVDLLGLKEPYLKPDEGVSPIGRRLRQLFVIIPFITVVWYWVKYLVLTKAKASKEDGRSEIYTFEPTRRDRIICWVFFLTSCSLVFIIVGIKALLGHY